MTGGTTIIREPSRGRRAGRLGAAGFVLPAPSFRTLARPAIDHLWLAIRVYPALLLGFTLAGALLWPATLAALLLIAPPTAAYVRLERAPTPDEVASWFLLAGTAAGAVVGSIQWLLLRLSALHTPLWIPGTALGWGLGAAAMVRAVFPLSAWIRTLGPSQRFVFWAPEWERYALLALVGALLGLIFGTAQWVVARRIPAPLPRRSLWIVASTLTWTLGFALIPLLPEAPYFVQSTGRFTGGFDAMMPGLIPAGALYGLLTAFTLTLLLRAASPQPVET